MDSRAPSYSKLNDIPKELLIEILLNLPVKSLLRCKTVSKSWYSLITNPNFIHAHLKNSSRNSFIILTQEEKGFSIHHDNTSFLQYMKPKLPSHILNPSLQVHGSSNGLICLSDGDNIYLWNPALRKLKTLPESLIAYNSHNKDSYSNESIAFGFHSEVNDYKVVRIFLCRRCTKRFEDTYKTEVYSLRRDRWRRIEVGPLFYFDYVGRQATVNGAAYWLGAKTTKGSGLPHGVSDYGTAFLCFEMGEEVFGEVSLPDLGSLDGIAVWGESILCLLQFGCGGCAIWTMEDCGNWTKRYCSILIGEALVKPLVFRKSGELLVVLDSDENMGIVESYDFEKKRVRRVLGIHGRFEKAFSYVESLIQLDGAENLCQHDNEDSEDNFEDRLQAGMGIGTFHNCYKHQL